MNSSPTVSTDAFSDPSHAAVAPAWQTVVVLFVLFGFSLLGALRGNLPGSSAHSRVSGYLLVMIVEWAIVAFIWHALSRRGIRMPDLVGGSWSRPSAFFRDFGIALAFLAVCGVGLNNAEGYLLKATPNPAMHNLFPHGSAEVTLYLMLSLTAGFCEEVIFRGYLQRQFAALTRVTSGGIVLQGLAFGASHGYQGWKFMVLIAVYGMTFGLLARWRRSLRPGMISHFLQDGVGGIVAAHFLR